MGFAGNPQPSGGSPGGIPPGALFTVPRMVGPSSGTTSIVTLATGDVVEAVEVTVVTAFDGTNPSLTIGTSGAPDCIVGATPLSVEGGMSSEGFYTASGATGISIYPSLGGSAVGSARVSLTIRKA